MGTIFKSTENLEGSVLCPKRKHLATHLYILQKLFFKIDKEISCFQITEGEMREATPSH